MTEERDERLVAALESIAVSLARLEKPRHPVSNSNYNVATEWPAPWSFVGVTTS